MPGNDRVEDTRLTYRNPVYDGYFADPFAWKHDGVYYAVGTPEAPGPGAARTERVFPLLRSDNLAQWEYVGDALERPDPALGADFWAPEVAFADGVFYLYYSVGHADREHHLRVATSPSSTGPYRDIGRPLVELDACPFSIDPHPFRDVNGSWYLFFARDFLDDAEGCRHGTALVVDRLLEMTRLAGEERTVLRARQDWQRFKADRPMYGRTFDWHTLEGPTVRRRNGRYYCFYSGGRWETEDYGVDYGVADHVLGPYDDSGNEQGPRVLATVPGVVRGPGHNSIISSPDGYSEFLVYHAWDPELTARRMYIDPLIWTPDGPRCAGPTLHERLFSAS